MPIGPPYVFLGEMSMKICQFFNWVIVVELYELHVYFGDEALVNHIICKHFLLFHRLPFHSVDCFLCFAAGFFFQFDVAILLEHPSDLVTLLLNLGTFMDSLLSAG